MPSTDTSMLSSYPSARSNAIASATPFGETGLASLSAGSGFDMIDLLDDSTKY
jgi:hypothetical protein